MPPRSAGKLRRRHAEPRDLQRRQLADALLEDQPRQHFVLRQLGDRGEDHLRVGGAAGDGDGDGHVAALRRAGKSRIGSRSPAKVTMPRSKVMRWVRMSSRPRTIWKAPTVDDRRDRAGDAQIAAELRIEPAAAHENPLRRADRRRRAGCRPPDRRASRGGSAVSAARGSDRLLDRRRRIDMPHVDGERIARQPLRHGDLGAVEEHRACQHRPGRHRAGHLQVGVEAWRRRACRRHSARAGPAWRDRPGSRRSGRARSSRRRRPFPRRSRRSAARSTTRSPESVAASARLRSTMPVSGSTKPPPCEVTRPENCGADAVPATAMSRSSAPCSAAPREASWLLPSEAAPPPVTRRSSGAPGAVPTVPATSTSRPAAPVMRLVRLTTSFGELALRGDGERAEPGVARRRDRGAGEREIEASRSGAGGVPVRGDRAGDRAFRAESGRKAVRQRRRHGVERRGKIERRAGVPGERDAAAAGFERRACRSARCRPRPRSSSARRAPARCPARE